MKYWNMFLRRVWIIIVSVIIIPAGVVLFVFLATPIYESDCKLLYIKDPSKAMLGDIASDDMMEVIGKADPIQSLIEIITTRPVLAKVIRTMRLKDKENKYIKPKDLKEKLEITVIPKTTLISIAYRDKNPILAAKVINTIAKVFVEERQNLTQVEVGAAKKFLTNQVKIQKEKLTKAESAINAFKKASGTVSLEDETRAKIQSISAIEAELLQIDAATKGINAKRIEVQNKINDPEARSNSFYSYWINTLEQVKSRQTELAAQKIGLSEQLKILTKDLDKLPPLATKLSELMRNEMIAKNLYTDLLAQYEEFKINDAVNISNVKIIEPAVVAEKPVFPDKKQMLIKAVLLSLVFGFGFAIFLEYFSGIPGSVEEIRKTLHSNLLGVIPLLKRTPRLFMVKAPYSAHAEGIRFIQSNLTMMGSPERKNQSFVITSALPADGKSTIAVNLACAFASLDKKTVIVEFDLRKPYFHKLFKMDFSRGISDFLTNSALFEEIVTHDTASNLTIIPSGSKHRNPSALATTDTMRQLIENLKTEFDIVIFDTPPITMASEALEIAKHVDSILLVVNANKNLEPTKEMDRTLTNAKLPVKGFIVNKYRTGKSVYRYYNKR